MSAASILPLRIQASAETPAEVTLLELVGAVSELTHDDREVVATVVHMLRTGRIRLCGNFRGTPPEDFDF